MVYDSFTDHPCVICISIKIQRNSPSDKSFLLGGNLVDASVLQNIYPTVQHICKLPRCCCGTSKYTEVKRSPIWM